MTDQLVKSVSIENVVSQRDAAVERIQQAHKLLAEAAEILSDASDKFEPKHEGVGSNNEITLRFLLTCHGQSALSEEEGLSSLVRKIDGEFWDHLLKASGMRTFMDQEARKQWYQNISDHKHPELTLQNVEATFEALHGARGDMFERGVLNAFRQLSWDYKTNSPIKFGKKIILDYFGSQWKDWYSINSETCHKLDDLHRVFCVLDGQPEPDHRDSTLKTIRAQSRDDRPGSAEMEYFSLRWFKKGSCHVTFTRPELAMELNRIVAKHHPNALAPARS